MTLNCCSSCKITNVIVAALPCCSWSQCSYFTEGGKALYYCLFVSVRWHSSSLLPASPYCSRSPTDLVFTVVVEKSVSVLLDLLFQFITQPPFTLTPACCQSPWPAWEPAIAVQSFTYWTMVRGGISRISASPSSSALFLLFTEDRVISLTFNLQADDGSVLLHACQLFLPYRECHYQPFPQFHFCGR